MSITIRKHDSPYKPLPALAAGEEQQLIQLSHTPYCFSIKDQIRYCNAVTQIQQCMWPQLYTVHAVQSLRLGGLFSSFGPFLFYSICPKILVLKFVQSLCILQVI